MAMQSHKDERAAFEAEQERRRELGIDPHICLETYLAIKRTLPEVRAKLNRLHCRLSP